MHGIVLMTTDGRRVVRKFRDEDVARRFFKKVQSSLTNGSRVFLTSLSRPIPLDEEEEAPRGMMHCPYCGEPRVYQEIGGINTCPVCRVSTRDFYVKSYNHLWETISRGKKGKK